MILKKKSAPTATASDAKLKPYLARELFCFALCGRQGLFYCSELVLRLRELGPQRPAIGLGQVALGEELGDLCPELARAALLLPQLRLEAFAARRRLYIVQCSKVQRKIEKCLIVRKTFRG